MIVLLHVCIALVSLGFTAVLWTAPSPVKLRTHYGLITATLASGTYLAVQTHAALVASCVSGLVYLGVVTAGALAARVRLAHRNAE